MRHYVMEGFARGIQHMIAGDWLGLAYVFRDVGFTPKVGSFADNACRLRMMLITSSLYSHFTQEGWI